MPVKIKICGIQRMQDAEALNEAMPDFAGFVFAAGRRKISLEKAFAIRKLLDKNIKTVGVFVNEDIRNIIKAFDEGVIDYAQLHGNEDEEYLEQIKKHSRVPIIKAIRVCSEENLKIAEGYDCQILFDAYSPLAYGGAGITFDWNILKNYRKPFFIAGGLKATNIEQCIKLTSPYCVDISSGVETEGIKDKNKIIEIVNLIRSVGNEKP